MPGGSAALGRTRYLDAAALSVPLFLVSSSLSVSVAVAVAHGAWWWWEVLIPSFII